MIKNQANIYQFILRDSIGQGQTGLSPTVQIRKDSGSFAAATNSVSEVSDGMYEIALTATECNCDIMAIKVSLPSGQFPAILANEYLTTTGGATPAEIWQYNGGRTVTNTIPSVNEIWGRQAGDTTSRTLTSSPTDISSLATADALSSVASNVSAVKAKTDNLPNNPAAVGSAMTLTEATVSTLRNNLATISTIEAAVVSLSSGLDTLASHGDTYWSTADISGLSTFNPSTDAVTLTDAYDAAKTTSQLTTSDLSTLATSEELTAASASLTTLINLLLSGLYHWQVNDTIMTVYNASDVAIGAYTLTKDTTGNITAVTPIVQQSENNEG